MLWNREKSCPHGESNPCHLALRYTDRAFPTFCYWVVLLKFVNIFQFWLQTDTKTHTFTQSVGFLGRGISSPQGRYLHTAQHKHRITHADIHTSSGVRTHDPSVWVTASNAEDSSVSRAQVLHSSTACQIFPQLKWIAIRVRVRVRVTLRLAVYRQSVRLGDKPLEIHTQNFYFPTEHLRL
jgi:hypothetical protein